MTFDRLGRIHRDAGAREAARSSFQRSLAIQRDSAETLLELGSLERDAGDWQAADRFYQRAIAIWSKQVEADPLRIGARDDLARAYLELGLLKHASGDKSGAHQKLDQALALSERLFHESPKHFDLARRLASIYAALGSLSHDLGRSQEARAWYEKALSIYGELVKRKPDNSVVRNELAWLLLVRPEPSLRDPGRALTLINSAVGKAPRIGLFRRTLGVAHLRLGDCKSAIAELEEAMKLRNGGDGSEAFFLAMAYKQRGDEASARTWYDRAVARKEQTKPKDLELCRFQAEAASLLRGRVATVSGRGEPTRWGK